MKTPDNVKRLITKFNSMTFLELTILSLYIFLIVYLIL